MTAIEASTVFYENKFILNYRICKKSSDTNTSEYPLDFYVQKDTITWGITLTSLLRMEARAVATTTTIEKLGEEGSTVVKVENKWLDDNAYNGVHLDCTFSRCAEV